jgi:hypothetical protein
MTEDGSFRNEIKVVGNRSAKIALQQLGNSRFM